MVAVLLLILMPSNHIFFFLIEVRGVGPFFYASATAAYLRFLIYCVKRVFTIWLLVCSSRENMRFDCSRR